MVKSLLELFEFSKSGAGERISDDAELILNRKPTSFASFVGRNVKLFQ
jgi:hypothetical protein